MSWMFYDKWQNVLHGTAVLNPKFDGSPDVGGADADLILDGTLIDFKATIRPETIKRSLLDQLLGYVLLDYTNSYRIEKVGLYFVRQGVLLQWPVDSLMAVMGSPKTPLSTMRQQFRRSTQRI